MFSFIGAKVKVQLKHRDDFFLTGVLNGSSKDESLVLSNARDTIGNNYSKIVIHGSNWLAITLEQTPFPLEGLFQRLKSIFPPNQVKYMPEIQAISVMGKINVTEQGVTGEGAIVDRVKTVYNQYIQDLN